MRRALVVGIDHYSHIGPLTGCVNDARAVAEVLERNDDGTVNFVTPRLIQGTATELVTKDGLKSAVRELFADRPDIALFYFAGHGYIEDTGGFLCSGDCRNGDDGLALSEVMNIAKRSKAKNKIIILDSCHSGVAGDNAMDNSLAEIGDGMTILTASTADQYAAETGGAGVFTTLLVDALEGAAANLMGDVTPGSVYAHVDQSLGPWKQRPVFKTNVQGFVSLRKAAPPIPLESLKAIARLFPNPGHVFALDPSFEPERSQEEKANPTLPPPDEHNTKMFAILQQFARVNLVRPVDAPHMWHAAMGSKACKLTVLGEHYRDLVAGSLI